MIETGKVRTQDFGADAKRYCAYSKAALPDANIIIDACCMASFDEAMHEKALDIMEGLHMSIVNR